MIPFWRDLYDRFKDRRYGTLFLVVLFLGGGLMFLAVALCRAWRPDSLAQFWPGIALFAMLAVWPVLRGFRPKRRHPWKHRPLSSNELRAARSKLLKNRNRQGV